MTTIYPQPEASMPVPVPSSSFKSFVWELVKILVLASITIALVRFFLFKPFYVQGASMEPNFYSREYLIIDELTYRLRTPERGEVIVFKYPGDQTEYFLKRIIGLPGERVKISGGIVSMYNKEHPEGIQIKEDYLPKDLSTIGDVDVQVGDSQYFVMGDNRPNSLDSRRFGPVDKSLIVGRAFFRGWPFSRMQKFEAPSFNF